MTRRVLHARRVLYGVAPDVQEGPARVHIDAGVISSVTPGPPAADDERLPDHVALTPAYVDGHTHAALHGLRGAALAPHAGGNLVEDLFYRFERHLLADDVRALATLGAYEALISGTALVWDHYGHAEALAEAFSTAGLSAVVAPTLQDRAVTGREPWIDGTPAAWRATERIASGAYRGVHAAWGPHATDTVSPALLTAIADAARSTGLPVHLHVAQSADEVARAAAEGTTPGARLDVLADVPTTAVHGLYLTERDLTAYATRPTTLIVCPSSQAWFGFPADIDAWEAAGCRWGVATDAAVSNDTLAVAREARTLALLRAAGLTGHATRQAFARSGDPRDAAAHAGVRRAHLDANPLDAGSLLARVTTIPGAMHPAFRAGAIAPGYRAHLLALDTEHPCVWPCPDLARAMTLADAPSAITRMMIDGVWRTASGAHAATLAAEPALDQARRYLSVRLPLLLGSASRS
jgi:5-methylthioadenosine/S-adenosylhomocysteine deaminase